MTIQACEPIGHHPKHPNDSKYYAMDWSSWLGTGITIATSAWVSTSGLSLDNDSITDSATKAQVRISGGTSHVTYEVTNTITTSDGQTVVAIFRIEVNDSANVKAA